MGLYIEPIYYDLAEENGIKKDTFMCRVERGWQPSKAAVTPPIKYAGPTKEEQKILAENGISRNLFSRRINGLGWSRDKALNTPVMTQSEIMKAIHAEREETETMKWGKVAVKNGININTFYSRVNIMGWDLEKAATKPSKKRSC